jgi:formamidopyrimidine-DNA glycosylase
MAKEEKLFEIIETKYQSGDKIKTKLNFLGALEEAKNTAMKEARKNVGTRYSVFPQGGFLAEFQAYYRTTIKCPKCGEVIPLE